MDTLKIRELLENMDASQRELLAAELFSTNRAARPGIKLEEITSDRVSDGDFAARIREEIAAALRGEI